MIHVNAEKTILCSFMLLSACACLDVKSGPADDWFEADWEQATAMVNEGELRLLGSPGGRDEHHHHTQVNISEHSLETGWVDLYQCHQGLDAVAALQIVYNADSVTGLRIESSSNIGRAWVEGSAVQLEDIQPGSVICLNLQSRALRRDAGRYTLKNGPFMRRFLDGYYPMRVSMDIHYPENRLSYQDTQPVQLSHRVTVAAGRLELDVRFEGRLYTVISFIAKQNQ